MTLSNGAEFIPWIIQTNSEKSFNKKNVAEIENLGTIENIEKTRSDAIKSKQEAAAKALKEEAKNTPIAKFKANLEARFYTALAKQITDNVFGADGAQQDSGTYTAANGEVITWSTPAQTGNVVVVVTETDGTTTTYTMPKEDNS